MFLLIVMYYDAIWWNMFISESQSCWQGHFVRLQLFPPPPFPVFMLKYANHPPAVAQSESKQA